MGTVRSMLAEAPVQWVEQAEQLGTGHAVEQALPIIPDQHTVLLLYGDVPLISVATLERLVAGSTDNSLALLTATRRATVVSCVMQRVRCSVLLSRRMPR